MTDIVCNNCGHRGHMYRECRKPVLSYGQMMYRMDPVPKLLMIMRKDSLCYIEFLRGKYDIYNLSYIQTLIDKCSNEEKQKLVNGCFDTLWGELWMLDDIDPENMRFKNDYLRGKSKYEKLRAGFVYTHQDISVDVEYFVNMSKTSYETSEWEFPKGRRNQCESDKECAQREFHEETGYESSDYTLIENMKPFSEEYVGENKVRYKHIYYIGYLTNTHKEVSVGEGQISEIRDIQWLTREECLEKIRDYHHTRYRVIHQLFEFISGLDTDYFVT